MHSYPPSPALPTMLPPHPHPRPIVNHGPGVPGSMPLPSLNTRSPPNAGSATSPTMEVDRMRDARDREPRDNRSESPVAPRGAGLAQPKREIVLHSAGSGSPSGQQPKGTPSPASSHGSNGSHRSHDSHTSQRNILLT